MPRVNYVKKAQQRYRMVVVQDDFEPWTLCNGCGSHWPCSTAAALAAASPEGEANDD